MKNHTEHAQYTLFKLSGISMRPLIKESCLGLVKIKNKRYYIGDIVVVNINEQLIAHRLVSIQKKFNKFCFITKGDSLINFDMPVAYNDILGKVIILHGERSKILLTSSFWRTVSYFLALSSLMQGGLYFKIKQWKKNIIGNYSSMVICLAKKILIRVIFSWPTLLLEHLFHLLSLFKKNRL